MAVERAQRAGQDRRGRQACLRAFFWVEEDIASRTIGDGACALRMGAQLVNTLFGCAGAAGHTYIQIRDDLLCWSVLVETNVFPHRNNGPEAIRLATNLLKLTTGLM